VAESDEEKADVLMESFFPISPPSEGVLTVRQAEEGQGTRSDPLPAVTDVEIDRAVTWPNPNKAVACAAGLRVCIRLPYIVAVIEKVELVFPFALLDSVYV
jgi:hypothetical protein